MASYQPLYITPKMKHCAGCITLWQSFSLEGSLYGKIYGAKPNLGEKKIVKAAEDLKLGLAVVLIA